MPLNLALLCDTTLKKHHTNGTKYFLKLSGYKRVPDDATRVHKGVGANFFYGVSVSTGYLKAIFGWVVPA